MGRGLSLELWRSARFIRDTVEKSRATLPSMQFVSAKTQVDFVVTETGSASCIVTGSEEVAGTHSLALSFGKKAKAGE